jgi:glycosyltransferase 2 family protein
MQGHQCSEHRLFVLLRDHPTLSSVKSHLPEIAFSAALLAFALSRVSADGLWQAAHQISPLTFLACVALATLQVFVASLRWHLMLAAVGVRLPAATTFKVNIVSLFANTLMINVVGGAITRIYLLGKMSVPSPLVLSTTALEKLLVTAVLGIMSVAGIFALHLHLAPRLPDYAEPAGMAVGATAFVVAAALILWGPVQRWMRVAIGYLKEMAVAARDFVGNWRALTVATLLTVLSQLMMIGIGGMLTVSLWQGVSLFHVVLVLPVTMLLAGLPISVGGWGVREFSTMVALGLIGVSADIGLLVSLLIFASTLGGIVVAALMMLPIHLNGDAAVAPS